MSQEQKTLTEGVVAEIGTTTTVFAHIVNGKNKRLKMTKTRKKRQIKFFVAKDLLALFAPETEVTTMAESLDTCRYTLYKWMQNDVKINEWAADRYAIRLGLHPSEIWTDWFDI